MKKTRVNVVLLVMSKTIPQFKSSWYFSYYPLSLLCPHHSVHVRRPTVWRWRSCVRSMRSCRRTCEHPQASRVGRPTATTPSSSELSWTAATNLTSSWRESDSVKRSLIERWWPSDIKCAHTHSLTARIHCTHTQQSGWVIYNSKHMLYIRKPSSLKNIVRAERQTQSKSLTLLLLNS